LALDIRQLLDEADGARRDERFKKRVSTGEMIISRAAVHLRPEQTAPIQALRSYMLRAAPSPTTAAGRLRSRAPLRCWLVSAVAARAWQRDDARAAVAAYLERLAERDRARPELARAGISTTS
jgi:hypothetical protein